MVGLRQQYRLSSRISATAGLLTAADSALREARKRLAGQTVRAAVELDRALALLQGGGLPGGGPPSLSGLRGQLQQLYGAFQGADVTPTTQLVAAATDRLAAADRLLAEWERLRTGPLLR